jgi:phosphoribosyl 1,2-cyclic phosphodiesterase
MALRFQILGSGSDGNAALLRSDDTRVLVDAGFSVRRLAGLLEAVGEKLETIDAIYLTHEHGDHAAALSGLARHPHIRVFANRGTAESVQRSLKHRPMWQLFETGATFRFRDLEVQAFSVPHDAQDPVGFVFAQGHGDLLSPRRSVAWLTDLGHVPAHIIERVRDVDVLALESNYCPALLDADTKRPWPVKQRISGRHGHLSNHDAAAFLGETTGAAWRQVFLAHLSRDCNSPAAVDATCGAALRARNCLCSIVPAGGGAPAVDLP